MSITALAVLDQAQSRIRRRTFVCALASRLAEGSARLVVAGLEYRLRRRTRVALLALDDRMLADIGLRRCRAARGQAHRYDLLP